ncbi:hypothetical protein [Desulfosporosinus sp. SB140]|uniref:hypothetical protein n=1 Tax=Desulfosporosinus paludis TaxID=3115649 RepID=UPI00388D5B27
MSDTSRIDVMKNVRKGGLSGIGYKREIKFADLVINNKSLYETLVDKGFDYVSCLGWSFSDIQLNGINKLLLKSNPDFDNDRYAIFICPECGDLGCGAISVNIKRVGDIIIWSDFAVEDNLGLYEIEYDRLKDLGPFYFQYDQYEAAIKSTFELGDTFIR